jgi:hypothetical protein
VKIRSLGVLVLLLAVASFWCVAQNSGSDNKGKSATRTVTGCLFKGSGDNQFVLTAQAGSSWDVSSDTVSLANQVGHEVAATGVVTHNKMHNMKEDAKDAAQDSGIKKDNTEHGHMKITSVNSVSSSCK